MDVATFQSKMPLVSLLNTMISPLAFVIPMARVTNIISWESCAQPCYAKKVTISLLNFTGFSYLRLGVN